MMPRFIYQLVDSELHLAWLQRIDRSIRKTIRSIVHLYRYHSAVSSFTRHSRKEACMQFSCLRQAVGIAKVKLYKKVVLSWWPIVATPGQDTILQNKWKIYNKSEAGRFSYGRWYQETEGLTNEREKGIIRRKGAQRGTRNIHNMPVH